MYCKNCGSFVDDNFEYCPNCGAKVNDLTAQVAQAAYNAPVNGAFDVLKNNFSSPLFLAGVILATVSAVLNLAVSGGAGIISAALSAVGLVGLWFLYSAAVSGDGRKTVRSFDIINVAATIQYVLGWVEVGLCALLGVMCFILAAVTDSTFFSEIFTHLNFGIVESELEKDIYEIIEFLVDNGTLVFVITGICCFAVAAISAVMTAFYFGGMRKCASALRDFVLFGTPPYRQAFEHKSVAFGNGNTVGRFGRRFTCRGSHIVFGDGLQCGISYNNEYRGRKYKTKCRNL